MLRIGFKILIRLLIPELSLKDGSFKFSSVLSAFRSSDTANEVAPIGPKHMQQISNIIKHSFHQKVH